MKRKQDVFKWDFSNALVESCHPSSVLSYPILFYTILSNLILSYPIQSYPILSYPIQSNPILPTLSYPIESSPILPYHVQSYPTLSYPIESCHIPSYPIQSCPMLSYPIYTDFSGPREVSNISSVSFLHCRLCFFQRISLVLELKDSYRQFSNVDQDLSNIK